METKKVVDKRKKITTEKSDYIRPKEMAAFFAVSKALICQQIALGNISAIRLGKGLFIPKTEIERMKKVAIPQVVKYQAKAKPQV